MIEHVCNAIRYCKISLPIYSGSSSLSNAGRFFSTQPVDGARVLRISRENANGRLISYLYVTDQRLYLQCKLTHTGSQGAVIIRFALMKFHKNSAQHYKQP